MRPMHAKVFLVSCMIGMMGLSSFAAPQNPDAYDRVSGSYLNTLPDGSIVQGSADFGGIQPDYIIDFEKDHFSELRESIARVRNDSRIDLLSKVFLIQKAVSSVLEKKLYTDKSNYLLALMYKDDRKDIPLSEYIRYRTGVCREHALILQKALSEAGVENHFVYAKIERETASRERVIEDHAFNTIKYQDKEWVIDAYFSGFNGYLFEDLLAGKSNPEQLSGFSHYRGQRRIIHLNSYPVVWIPKPSKAMSCNKLFQ